MRLEVSNEIRLSGYPPALHTKLARLFTLENPKALEAERMGRRFDLADRFLYFWRLEGGALVLPRGAARTVMHMAEQYGGVVVDDRRLMLPPCGYTFHGE